MTTPIRIELPTQFGMKSVNAYLFLGDEPTLIDCGENSDQVWEALENSLAIHHLEIKDLKRVIITHAHVDHIGMAGRIIENSSAELWISEYGYEWAIDPALMIERRLKIAQEYFGNLGTPPSGSFIEKFIAILNTFKQYWDPIPKERVYTFKVEDTLHINGTDWQSIYAPGHCINQICLYEKESKILISADMILYLAPSPVIDPALTAPYQRVKALPMLLRSFEKFRQLEVSIVYPGHYTPITDYQDLIERQVKRIYERVEECFQAIQKGTSQFWDLLEKLYAGRVGFMAVPMLMGYLDVLQDTGRISSRVTDGVLNYYVIN